MNTNAHDSIHLASRHCQSCTPASSPLKGEKVLTLLAQLDGWELDDSAIRKTFSFSNFHQTMSFVNAIAWIANQQDHHPELAVTYNQCRVTYSTHVIHGLSENDFICAARIDALLSA